MAKSGSSRCLHCGARLPLYRQLTEAGFCSSAHRKAYTDDQARLAVERLLENQQMLARASEEVRELRLMAEAVAELPELEPFVPAPVFEDCPEATIIPILDEPPQAQLARPALPPVAMKTPDLVAADPIAYDLPAGKPRKPAAPELLFSTVLPETQGLLDIRPEAFSGPGSGLTPVPGPIDYYDAACELPGSLESGLEAGIVAAAGLRRPNRFDAADMSLAPGLPAALDPRGATWLPLASLGGQAAPEPPTAELESIPLSVPCSSSAFTLAGGPQNLTFRPCIEPPPPVSAVEAPRIPALERLDDRLGTQLRPNPAAEAARLPEPTGPVSALAPLNYPSAANIAPRPAELATARSVNLATQINPVSPTLTWGMKNGEFEPLRNTRPGGYPGMKAPGLTATLPLAAKVPIPSGKGAAMPHTVGLTRRALLAPDAFPGRHVFPKAGLKLQQLAGEDFLTLAASFRPAAMAAQARSTARYLKTATRGIQIMAMAVPVLLFIAFRPAPAVTETTSAVPGPVGRFMNSRMTAVRAALQNRAGIEYLDDFRTGLDNWESTGDLTQSWSYDQAGFVRPGPLALYKPSLGMQDYQFEFLGQIGQHSLGWVFRAQDLRNYYVAKLVVLRSGPLPSIGIERYAVINGRPGPRVQAALPLSVHQDTVYRVRMEIRGADYAIYVQDQLVHFWSDPRLMSGGVGFFSSKGEQSRIRWMQVSHQYDALGRLCAYFAPMAVMTYNLEPSMGAGTK